MTIYSEALMEAPDKRKQAIGKYRRWLQTIDWSWYVTLTIRDRRLTDAQMNELFTDWILEVERVYGDSTFRWVRVFECGSTRRSCRFHVLIGGLRNRRKDSASRWNFLGGDAVIDRYDPDKNVILSMLTTIDENGRLDINFKPPEEAGVVVPIPSTDPSTDRSDDEDVERPEITSRLRLANISDAASPGDLRSLFSRFGTVSEVRIHSFPEYTFVLLDMTGADSSEDAAAAVERWNGRRWRGRVLRVEQVAW
jgi:hypothetical protein